MVARLRNTIRDYAWGSRTAIPELTGVEPDGRPQAELWMGAHESASSVLLSGETSGETLYDLVSADPAGDASQAPSAATRRRRAGRIKAASV